MKKEIWDAVAGIDERFILEAAEVQRQPARKKNLPESGSKKLRATTRRWSWGKAAIIVFCLGLTAAGVALLLRLAPWSSGGQKPGATPLPEVSDPSETEEISIDATRPSDHIESGLDEEIQAAIDAHENKRFWRVEESGTFPKTVSIYTWTKLDVQSFWPELRDRLFGTDLQYSSYTNSNASFCNFNLDGKLVKTIIYPYGEILFICKIPKIKNKIAELLTEEEIERLGLPLEERNEDYLNNEIARTLQLGELPLDFHIRTEDGSMYGCCGIYTSGYNATLSLPMGEIRATGSLSSESLLTPEDVETTILFLNELDLSGKTVKCVDVCQSCEPVYYADTVSGTIRPAWRVSGIQYIYWTSFENYETHRLVLIVDAQSGEVFTAEGEGQ